MTILCLAPVIMAGYLQGIETFWHHQAPIQGEVLEVHSCLSGPSVVGTLAPTSGLYGAGLEWGFPFVVGPLVVGIVPQMGISHDSYGYRELPMGTQFEVGGMVYGAYNEIVIGVKYWHLSNAGLKQPNIGLDLVGVMAGYQFK